MVRTQLDPPGSKASSVEGPRILSCSGAELLTLAQTILQQGHRFRMRAPGLSMGRTIRHGGLIEIAPCQSDDLRVGTIAFYQREGIPVAHRIIRRRQDGGTLTFLLRGDTLRGSAEVIPSEDILGRVTAVHRGDRWQPLPRRTGWCLFGRLTPQTANWTWGLIQRVRTPAGRVLRTLLGFTTVRGLLRRVARRRAWRRATPSDRALLMSFYQVGGSEEQQVDVVVPSTVEGFPCSDFLVVEDGRRLIGAVGVFREEDAPEENPWRLYSMKVHWRYRGHGIGELLLQAVMETVQQEGGSAVTLGVLENNAPAISFYEKHGFRRTTARPHDFSDSGIGDPSLIQMELMLGD